MLPVWLAPVHVGVVVEAGLGVYVVAALVGLAFGRPPRWAPPVAAAAAAAAGAHLAGVGPLTGAATGGWGPPAEWWPSAYLAGGLAQGGAHHDVQAAVLGCLVLAGVALGGFNCAGWSAHEYVALLFLLAGAGLATLATDHLGALYLTLELQALTVYTLVGYYRVRVVTSEAALKYLLVGSAVSGLLLVGVFQAYAGSGSFALGELRFDLPDGGAWLVGAVLFKVGAAPFHFWAPGVYESVEWPTLVALVSFAKLNLWLLLWGSLHPVAHLGWWQTALAGAASVVVGGVGGLYQTSVGGVLGYSAALNAGYLLLVGSTGLGGPTRFSLFLYLVGYSVGAAALGAALAAGFGNRPLTAGVSTLATGVGVYYLALNLGGLPVYPGFAAKLYLLWAAAPAGLPLGVAIVGASVFAAVYYLEASGFFILDVQPPRVAEPTPTGGSPVGALLFVAATAGALFVGELLLAPPM